MTAKTVIDPVCGMSVDPDRAAGQSVHEGTTYAFCSASCKQKFDREPGAVSGREAGRAACPFDRHGSQALKPPPRADAATYTCPMHPQIIRSGPGSCPICGMALEPLVATQDEGPNPELVEMRRRFWVCLGPRAPPARPGDGGDDPGAAPGRAHPPARPALGRARAGDPGRPLGRVAVLRPGLGVDRSVAASTCSR